MSERIQSHISVPPKNFSADPKPTDPRAGRGKGNTRDKFAQNYDSIFRKKKVKK